MSCSDWGRWELTKATHPVDRGTPPPPPTPSLSKSVKYTAPKRHAQSPAPLAVVLYAMSNGGGRLTRDTLRAVGAELTKM